MDKKFHSMWKPQQIHHVELLNIRKIDLKKKNINLRSITEKGQRTKKILQVDRDIGFSIPSPFLPVPTLEVESGKVKIQSQRNIT